MPEESLTEEVSEEGEAGSEAVNGIPAAVEEETYTEETLTGGQEETDGAAVYQAEADTEDGTGYR